MGLVASTALFGFIFYRENRNRALPVVVLMCAVTCAPAQSNVGYLVCFSGDKTSCKKVTKIEWTFHTSNQEGSGTDSNVTIKILRDGNQLTYVNLEPGETARLDRGQVQTYW